jgi:hypothetical protein
VPTSKPTPLRKQLRADFEFSVSRPLVLAIGHWQLHSNDEVTGEIKDEAMQNFINL